jgi:hypothetical protein
MGKGKKLRLPTSLLAGAALLAAVILYPLVHAAPASAQSDQCSSYPGYLQIQAMSYDMYVRSEGGGNPVEMQTVGSCYKPTKVGTYDSEPVYTYYNQDDRCLYWNTTYAAVFTAVNANGCAAQANEEFVGIDYKSGTGWLWYSIEALDEGVGSDANIFGYPCTNGGELINYETSGCEYWNFPSDGG